MTLECAEKRLGDDFFLAQDIRAETSVFISREQNASFRDVTQDIKTWVLVVILDFSPWISNSVFILAH